MHSCVRNRVVLKHYNLFSSLTGVAFVSFTTIYHVMCVVVLCESAVYRISLSRFHSLVFRVSFVCSPFLSSLAGIFSFFGFRSNENLLLLNCIVCNFQTLTLRHTTCLTFCYTRHHHQHYRCRRRRRRCSSLSKLTGFEFTMTVLLVWLNETQHLMLLVLAVVAIRW